MKNRHIRALLLFLVTFSILGAGCSFEDEPKPSEDNQGALPMQARYLDALKPLMKWVVAGCSNSVAGGDLLDEMAARPGQTDSWQ